LTATIISSVHWDFVEHSAARYHRLQLALSVLALVLGAGWLLAMTLTAVARLVAELAMTVTDRLWWAVLVVSAATSIGHTVLTAPLTIARSYWLPRRYGLLHQRLAAWAFDRLKAAALGGLVGLIVIEVIYAVMARTPAWWIFAAAFVATVSLLGAVVFPVWIVPLFYTLTPLRDAALAERLEKLARRAGVPVLGVWLVDQSRKSRTLNAAVAGFGRTRRIILFDTLLERLGPDEVESVLAHELGHHAHHDMWRMVVIQTALGFATFWVADQLLRATAGPIGLRNLADPAGVPWFALVIGALGLVGIPLVNWHSRAVERRADDFALSVTGDAGAFISAMERLAEQNLAERHPPRWKETLLSSHPSVDRRIGRARRRVASAPRASESE